MALCFNLVCTSHAACLWSHLSLFHLHQFDVISHRQSFFCVLIVTRVTFLKILKMKPAPIKHDRQKCIVPGCHSTRRSKHHVFPKDVLSSKERLWVEAVSNPHLNDQTYEEIYDNGYRVCHLHFTENDYVCGRRNVFKKSFSFFVEINSH